MSRLKGILSDSLQRRPRISRSALVSRLTFRNLILVTGLVASLGIGQYLVSYTSVHRVDIAINRHRPPGHERPPPHVSDQPPLPCLGPRGKLISESPEDQVQAATLKAAYPTPWAGSYKALGLPEEWMTAEGRYGPYGYDDDKWFGGRSAVDWDAVDWGSLQQHCQERNHGRFPPGGQTAFDATEVRLRLRSAEDDKGDSWFYNMRARLGFPRPDEYSLEATGKTALVLRTHDRYKYTEEDVLNIRSMVSEAGLQSGGEYAVVLYVNVKDPHKNIFESAENYARALHEANIPAEFHSLVVLWDDNLLRSWYPKVRDHSIEFQITQALQLFALFYPEFEHHWQLEMDMRSTGHTLALLRALNRFSTQEPRKQSWERASYLHLGATQGDYHEGFAAAVNATLGGGATIWGPVRIPEIPNPLGPPPPSPRPEDDAFRWGVGERADVVATSPCSWALRTRAWAYRTWLGGPFSQAGDVPRIMCPPAVQRASRQLLLAVHAAQARAGLAVPSEATLPTFALWHGLKLSFPPLPVFRARPLDPRTSDLFFNGGAPGEALRLATPPEDGTDAEAAVLAADVAAHLASLPPGGGGDLAAIPFVDRMPRPRYRGFAAGEAFYNQRPRVSLTDGLTYWWRSSFPRRLYASWSGGRWARGEVPGGVGLLNLTTVAEDGAGVLVEERGQVWAPAVWLHPLKTRE